MRQAEIRESVLSATERSSAETGELSDVQRGNRYNDARQVSRHSEVGMLRAAWIIAAKDLKIEYRERSAIVSAVSFSILGITLFFFAWDPTGVSSVDLAPGVLWVVFSFGGLLALHRSFGVEQPTRAIDALLAAPIERESIYLGKALANFVFVLVIQLISVPALILLYNLPLDGAVPMLCLVIGLATLGLIAVGTLFSAMAVNTRLAELLLPLLSLPFFVPIVICAAQSTAIMLSGRPVLEAAAYLKVLVAYDVVAVVLCTLVYPYLIEQ